MEHPLNTVCFFIILALVFSVHFCDKRAHYSSTYVDSKSRSPFWSLQIHFLVCLYIRINIYYSCYHHLYI